MKGELQVPSFASRYGPKKTLYPRPHKVDEYLVHLGPPLKSPLDPCSWPLDLNPFGELWSWTPTCRLGTFPHRPHQGWSRCGATPKQVTLPRKACHPTLNGCAFAWGENHIFLGTKNSPWEYIGFPSRSRNIVMFPQGRCCSGVTLHLLNNLVR
jgi:hypothetical protein